MSEKSGHGAELDFAERMSYGDYLDLGAILNAQSPQSSAHDEMLFIVQHQTSELWMRLAIHELRAARDLIAQDNVKPAFKMLTRVARIFEQLNSAWDVLRTMTPSEYTEFRPSLGQSSGFQSYQYRMIEYMLGNRQTQLLKVHAHTEDIHAALSQELEQLSLYQVALNYAAKTLGSDFDAGPAQARAWDANPAALALWQAVYTEPEKVWQVYELAEKLVDLEDYFRRWRFNHVTTVERIIGFKRGTGGTNGVAYLRKMLETELFPELWNVRSEL